MEPPDLQRLWETFVRIGPCRSSTFEAAAHIVALRHQVIPVIETLRSRSIANWFSLMLHDDQVFAIGDVPRGDAVWHLRFSLAPTGTADSLKMCLPDYFEGTRQAIHHEDETVSGLEIGLLKLPRASMQWFKMGQLTEWLLDLLSLYREDADPRVILADLKMFSHFFQNPISPLLHVA